MGFAGNELFQGIKSFIDRVADRPWIAMVEFLLIGSVVYVVLRFLQGTRGARLVRSVLIILGGSFAIVWLLAEKFDSERIKVLYPFFIMGVFLISLVAFQVELRRFLLRLGAGGWLFRWMMKNSDQAIDPLVVAVERLAKKKIGAILAIERTIEVGAIAETGVRLDALVSAELLETIFWPGTSLHDLGVVIHQGRIIAAGCQFPLAESADIDRSLGSRHRAALGMSQDCDAVVIVVSEETGTISIALHGRLRRALSPAALRAMLETELVVEPSKPAEASEAPSAKAEAAKAGTHGTGQAA